MRHGHSAFGNIFNDKFKTSCAHGASRRRFCHRSYCNACFCTGRPRHHYRHGAKNANRISKKCLSLSKRYRLRGSPAFKPQAKIFLPFRPGCRAFTQNPPTAVLRRAFIFAGLGNVDFDVAASQPVSIVMDDVVMENVVLKSAPLFRYPTSRSLARAARNTVRPQHASRRRQVHHCKARRRIRRHCASRLWHLQHGDRPGRDWRTDHRRHTVRALVRSLPAPAMTGSTMASPVKIMSWAASKSLQAVYRSYSHRRKPSACC